MSIRAGIVVTGTEVLSGRVTDRNGPWLAERLLELGVELTSTIIVGDRPGDVEGGLRFLAGEGCALIITSGGLGPTADDLTAEVVGAFHGRGLVLDEALEQRIADIVRPLMARWPDIDPAAVDAATRKQAMVPEGATVLEPVGTAPGLVVAPREGATGPTVVVLPGPPTELQPMWQQARATELFAAAVAGAVPYHEGMLRLFGIPESEIAETLRIAEADGVALGALEITTCLRSAEIEMVTRYQEAHAADYAALVAVVRERHASTLYSEDGSSVDEQVFALLAGDGSRPPRRIAVAESCTGGLMLGRLTSPPGASEHVLGGVVVYSDEAKVAQAGVDPALIQAHGAVSREVAEALADGALARFGADVGVGITGIAGPGGGSEDKPVGLVWFSVADREGRRLTRRVNVPGSRGDVRERSTIIALHLVRRLLLGESAPSLPGSDAG